MTQPTITETKIVHADATALGVFGLALVTFVASTQKLGWTTGSVYLMPWSLLLGSLAQIWAAGIDFKRNSYFGAIVLGAFGLFWAAVTLHWGIANGWFGAVPANADPRQFGWACFGFLIFSVFITVAAFEANKVFGVILVLILVLLGSLGLQLLGVSPELFGQFAAWAEFFIALLGFYAAGAIFLNTFFGRTLLPLGKPMGWVKKGG
ncbi:transcriptional regulator [Betaproteobacteria bacterium]|nr:transcriptional regulator [Betaproteobacteria bacterium]GHU24830.1 transcriptional regulator [Betaproteobacteria bacterium]